MADSTERLLKLHSHTRRCFGVPCTWWLKWAIILIFLKILSALSAVLMAARGDLYFSVAASKTPSSPGFSRAWHFSCHAIQLGPNWGWADSRHPPLPKLTTIVHSWRVSPASLALCYIFIGDWISAALDVKVFPADFLPFSDFVLNCTYHWAAIWLSFRSFFR